MLPLLRTQTIIPPSHPDLISRQRLLDQMIQGTSHALTLIIAPAGFGKTTLAAAWAHTSGLKVAWLTLLPANQTRERFLSVLIQAFQSKFPEIGQTALALLNNRNSEGIIFSLINDLAEIETDFFLILDDFHIIDNPETADVLQFILDNRPPTLHLVLVTRTYPSLHLARMLALGQAYEISMEDLRFTPDEMEEFLSLRLAERLSPDILSRLDESTEGWAVGLQLAALTLKRHPNSWSPQAGQEHIFDYLAEEVLRREPPIIQEFLKWTALIDRFTPDLCERLLPKLDLTQTDGEIVFQSFQDILRYVEHANLFLVPLDDSHTWYRYHALFTEFLRRQIPDAATIPVYLAASQWHEDHGYLDEAVHYAIHAQDYHRAADLIEAHYRDLLQLGERATLLDWIQEVPEDLQTSHPFLWIAQAWANVITFNYPETIRCLRILDGIIPSDNAGEKIRKEMRMLNFLGCVFSGKMDLEDEVQEMIKDPPDEEDHFLNTMIHFNIGVYQVLRGYTGQAIAALEEALHRADLRRNPLIAITAQVQIGETRLVRGATELAARAFQRSIAFAKETMGEHSFLLGMPYISYADLLREKGQFDDAIQFIEKGIKYVEVWQPMVCMDGLITLARIYAARKDWQGVETVLDRAQKIASQSPSILDDNLILVQRARLEIIHGDLVKAAHYLDSCQVNRDNQPNFYAFSELHRLLRVRIQIADLPRKTGDAGAILLEISSILKDSQDRERISPMIEANLLRAYVNHSLGKNAEVLQDLNEALVLGAQSGYLRLFIDEGRPLFSLLQQYRYQVHAPQQFIDTLIQEFEGGEPSFQKINRTTEPQQTGTFPLTRREIDILYLIAQGKSNQEIADECYLTLNTVKKHVANILGKLGVANRTQAGLLAKKSGWIKE